MGEIHWHAISPREAMRRLRTDKDGLNQAEVPERLALYGKNEIAHVKRTEWYEIFLRQFKNLLIAMLIAAALISVAIGHETDAIAISAAVLLSVSFGFIQEYRAEKALEALKKMTSPQALVVRDGKQQSIPTAEIVPGDIIVLEEGAKVPADCRVLESVSLSVDESSLTGESHAVHKQADEVRDGAQLAERSSILHTGTTVVRGHGRGIAFATGMRTEFGKIAESISRVQDEQTPLQKHLDDFGRKVGIAAILLCAVFFIIGVLNSTPPAKMFVVAVALAVAAIPEGLPTIITITLAIGMQRMAKHNAIVRKLPAVETLGSVTVICTDKTGTLTENKMTVREAYLNGEFVELGGEGKPGCGARAQGKARLSAEQGAHLENMLLAASLCNNASVSREAGSRLSVSGDPTEAALLMAAEKCGMDTNAARKSRKFVFEIPFDSERKMMSSVWRSSSGEICYVKGAPEQLLRRSSKFYVDGMEKQMDGRMRARILEANNRMASGALRLIAVACKKLGKVHGKGPADLEEGLVFLGIIGMIDPPRPEAREAIATCRRAGISVVMITGDNKHTAIAIGRELGLLEHEHEAIEGSEIDGMDEREFALVLSRTKIYSRVTPEHKYRIVNALMKRGNVVAVTGDGVNDAPAIKRADIGLAMGITGTDVTKEVADIVLTDDNFATIVKAIKYGRTVYNNIKNFIKFQFSTNVAALVTMFASALAGFPLPLSPIQILWINIIMDGPPALALGVEPPAANEMEKPPRDPKAKFLSRSLVVSIILSGLLMAAGTLFVFYKAFEEQGIAKASTVAFTTFVLFQLFNALNCKSANLSVAKSLFSNKYLMAALLVSLWLHLVIVYLPAAEEVFGTVPLSIADWLLILPVSASILILDELRKYFFADIEPM